ncbi:MAG: hypothetical protein MUC50_22325, partial [Myxococcota bacterium]|nr:hypothetical protein [Myxococcota bacterium]
MPRRTVVAVALVAVCACQAGRRGPEPPALPLIPTVPESIDDKATHYGRPAVRSPTQAETAAFERIAAATGLSCALEPLLGSVAREHAEDLAVQGARARSSDLDRLRFMVHQRGGVDYWLMPFYGSADEAGIADL